VATTSMVPHTAKQQYLCEINNGLAELFLWRVIWLVAHFGLNAGLQLFICYLQQLCSVHWLAFTQPQTIN